jgi:hypothetical protein
MTRGSQGDGSERLCTAFAAEAAADAAAGAGKKYVVVRVDVGSDAKALEKVSPRMPWW